MTDARWNPCIERVASHVALWRNSRPTLPLLDLPHSDCAPGRGWCRKRDDEERPRAACPVLPSGFQKEKGALWWECSATIQQR
jgi:hypothetical protein